MKRILFTLLIGIGICASAEAQGLKLNGYANYLFDDSFDTRYSPTSYFYGKIFGGFQWGIGLEYMPSYDYGVELVYYRQDTEARVTYYRAGERTEILPISINYIMVGGNRYAAPNDRVEGFGGLLVGAVVYDNKEPLPGEPNSVTKFAWGIRLGGNVWLAENVGIKADMSLFSAVQSIGGSFYFGTGGSGAGVSTFSTLFQFGLGGGLVIRFGE